ncbi:IS3 family transposase, partial [Corynebacterium belfantii]|nr:IS3 family transposase [Corynebacterium belfantii]
DNGGVQSMSRKANCYDNAVMENFFGHLKTEMYHGEVFGTVEEEGVRCFVCEALIQKEFH